MPAVNPIKTCPGCDDPVARKSLPVDQQCSGCRKKERNRVWREANPGAMALNSKRWRDAGNKTTRPVGYAEQQRIRMREQYQENPEVRERVKAAAKKRRLEKPEVIKAEMKAWLDKNRPKVREYQRLYAQDHRLNDPNYLRRSLEAQSMWRLRNWARDPQSNSWIRHAENQAIDHAWRAHLHAWQEDHCYLCNRPTKTLTIEHLIPRSRSGPTTKQNIVFTCRSCNYSRQSRIFWTEWRPPVVEPNTDRCLLRFRTIPAALAAAGIGGQPATDGSFILSTQERKDRPLFIVSTFFGSERNPGSDNGHVACRLRETHPTAIILFDREWYVRRDAVLNMLRSKMGIANRRPGARHLDVAEIDSPASDDFLRRNHVMGPVDAPFRIGLLAEGILVGLGIFADRGETFECVRLAFDGHVPGGMSKIMQGLWRLYGKRTISSYVDVRYANGDGHETIGFHTNGSTPDTYSWVLPDRTQHQRYLSNDNKMSRSLIYFSTDISREDNIRANGIFKIWLPGRLRMRLEP